MMEDKIGYFECECFSLKHIIRFSTINLGTIENPCLDLILDTNLCQHNTFWQRVMYGISYIFNRDISYGYAETILRIEDIPRLRKVLDDFELKVRAAK